jgi:hypothetical protein
LRLVAVDGLTIRQITRSTFIREALAAKFPKRNIPACENGMMLLIENFYLQIRKEMMQEVSDLKAQGVKFSATLDEWTSMKNIRFISINLHHAVKDDITKFFNLGMVEIVGSCNADKMVELVS